MTISNLKTCVIILSMLFCIDTLSQVRATTQHGRKVILYNDFTWNYEDEKTEHSGINKIDVDSKGLMKIEIQINNHHLSFYNGNVFFDNIQPVNIEYYTNDFFAKSVGKIKKISFHNCTISFDYHQNSIFKTSEGKLKTLDIDKQTYHFEYFENDFFEKIAGKLKKISSGNNSIEIEYHYNTISPEIEGKLKSINGSLDGVRIRYLE